MHFERVPFHSVGPVPMQHPRGEREERRRRDEAGEMGRSRRTSSGPPTVRGPGRKSKKQKVPLLPRSLQAKDKDGKALSPPQTYFTYEMRVFICCG